MGPELHHLDISYNSFQSQELAMIAKALAQNRTLWGLHMDGGGYVDANGFLTPPEAYALPQPRPLGGRLAVSAQA